MDVRMSVSGIDPVDGMEQLAEWLREEPQLRGRVAPAPATPAPGELGALTDVLVAAVSSGGAVSVLAASLKAFLAQPRGSDLRITLECPDGRRVDLEAKRISDVERLVERVLGQPE
jgi:hypothetical protein